MPTYTHTYPVARAADEAFDVFGTHLFENHPRWEAEVLEIRPLTPGPVGLGSRAVMVRREGGRTMETVYEIAAFEPGRRITAIHPDGRIDFRLDMRLEPKTATSCELTVTVTMGFRGAMKPLSPIFGLQLKSRTDRITGSMVALIEGRTPGAARSLQPA